MERIETSVFNDNAIEHLHRYAFANLFVKNKIVLDIASGEGYGSNLLSIDASKVYGVDISQSAIEAASKKYKKDNLQFLTGKADSFNLPDSAVDVVVSFETIEHHDKHEEMLIEIKRVLKSEGVFIISSPDKKFYTDIPNHHNPWHIKELYEEEFKQLINKHFKYTIFCAQNITRASIIVPEKSELSIAEIFDGNYNAINKSTEIAPLYNIAVASDNPLPKINFSLFNGFEIDEKNKLYQKENLARKIKVLENSYSYRLGHFILAPLRWLMYRK